MLWGCFSANGPGRLVRVHGIMKKENYLEILKENIQQSAEELSLGEHWIFQHDNDHKHTAKIVKKRLDAYDLNVLK